MYGISLPLIAIMVFTARVCWGFSLLEKRVPVNTFRVIRNVLTYNNNLLRGSWLLLITEFIHKYWEKLQNTLEHFTTTVPPIHQHSPLIGTL